MHVVWRSRTSGVLEIWYRVDGEQRFTKLYSDVPNSGALIQVAPHPTLLYNTQNGAPGEDGKPGLAVIGGFYRASTAWTNEYWWDGMRRRQSEATVLTGFPSTAAGRGTSPPPVLPSPRPAAPPAALPAAPPLPFSRCQATKTCGSVRKKAQPRRDARRRPGLYLHRFAQKAVRRHPKPVRRHP
jgi:hypothetical protein